MKCEVERYERGTDLTIEDWMNQMETYFSRPGSSGSLRGFQAHEDSSETP